MTDSLNSQARRLAEPIFDLSEAGRMMHESWAVTKRSHGFHGPSDTCCAEEYELAPCTPTARCKAFHADLIPWGDLPQKQKDININAFRDVFEKLAPKAERAILEGMREALMSTANEWEDGGSLACMLLDAKGFSAEFSLNEAGLMYGRLDCEGAKALANAAISRLRTEAESLKSSLSALPAPGEPK
jgi:hypothetical protein